MAIKTENLYRKLFDNLNSQGFNPTPKSATTGKAVVPEEADYLEFDLESGPGKTPVSLSVEKINDRFNLVVYMDDEAYDADTDITTLLPKLRYIAKNSGIHGFTIKNHDHLQHDQQKRMYMKKQEQIAEGYYPMGKKASYNDAVPNVKIVLQHTRQIEEGEQRYRNIAKIFLENEQGERILAPTMKPGIARVYARHIAEGGVPNDDRWNHIKSLCEEYQKMAGFVRAVRGNQFNESTQRLVNEGVNHYQSLRETLSRLAGHRGYNAYFESYTPALMEDDTDTSTLNELFVQETVDPRIESVMPILARLHKNINEMSEVNELANWADKVIESEETMEAVEEVEEATDLKTIPEESVEESHMDKLKRLGKKVVDIIAPGDEDLIKDLQRKAGVPVTGKVDDTIKLRAKQLAKDNPTDPAGNFIKGGKDLGIFKEEDIDVINEIPDTQFHEEEEVEESGLQAYLGNKKYGKEGMDALRKAGREHASKEKMAQIRAKYDKLDEEGEFAGDYATGPAGQWRNVGPKANKPATVGDLVGEGHLNEMDKSQPSSDRGGESSGDPYAKGGKATPISAKKAKKDFLGVLQKSVDKHNKAKQDTDVKVKKHMKEGQDDLDFIKGLIPKNTLKEDSNQVKFLGFNGATYPLQKAIADKAFRMGTLRSMKMDSNGRPYAIINDPESMGDYKAYWNDSVGAWTVDFD